MSTRYTRGVWSLENVENKYPDNDWVELPKVFVNDPNTHGYYAGGASPGYPGGVAITPPNPGPSASSIVTKLAYSTETAARQPSADLPSQKVLDAGTCSSSKAGYMIGGMIGSGRSSKVVKLTYASDTTAELSPTIPGYPNGVQAAGAFQNGDTAGYITGGKSGSGQDPLGGLNLSRKFVYSGETWSSLPTLGYYINNIGQPLSSPTSGYVAGGTTNSTGPAPIRSWVSKYNFSTDANSRTPSMDLTYPVKCMASAGDSTAGYLMGGGLTQPGYTSITTNINKFTYATETASLNPSKLPTATMKADATGNKTDGYSAGGSASGGYQSNFAKINFTTGTASAVSSQNLVQEERIVVSAFSPVQGSLPETEVRWINNESPSPNMGYMIGGEGLPSSGNNYRNYVKIDFDTETWDGANMLSFPSGNPQLKRAATVSSNTAGYVSHFHQTYGGGAGSSTQVFKVLYATDANSALPNLSNTYMKAPAGGKGVQSVTDGYIFSNPSPYPIQKLTFATDTNGVQQTGNPSGSGLSFWGTTISDGNIAGYMIGGSDRTEFTKLEYSTGTVTIKTTVPPAGGGLIYSASANSIPAGYVFAGDTGSPSGDSRYSLINKYTYSTDTWTVPTTPSGENGKWGWGTGNTEFAVYGQGYGSPGWGSNIFKYVYATDTRSVMDQTPASSGSYGSAVSASNRGSIVILPPTVTPTPSTTNLGIPEKGYIAGGFGNVSSISKLDMASETYTRLTTSLSETNRRLGGFGNLTQGYAAAGTQPVRSWCQKLVYSTETRTTLTSQMQSARGYLRAIGNNTIGYVGGGTGNPSSKTQMDKMPYSTETFSTLPSIPTSRYRYASLGNQTQAYFAGGYPNAMSKVTKITYSNDSYATTPTLSYSATFQTGAGNATKGYVVSGEGGGTRVDKITFSNDTPARVPSANLSATRYATDGNNSPTKAYFTGGSPGVKTNTEVITFSNDTTALSTTANADTGDNQAGAFAAFGPNHCGNPGSDIHPNVI